MKNLIIVKAADGKIFMRDVQVDASGKPTKKGERELRDVVGMQHYDARNVVNFIRGNGEIKEAFFKTLG